VANPATATAAVAAGNRADDAGRRGPRVEAVSVGFRV
jgi:hypothetical protein